MKRALGCLGCTVILALFTPKADAAHGIYLDDLGIGGGPEVVMVDGTAAGVFVAGFGTTTHADAALDGVVSYNGAVGAGSVFGVNVTTGISKPVIGPTRIDVNTVNVSTTGAGRLRIGHADTDFSTAFPGKIHQVVNSMGGTTDGTVTATFGANDGNVVFAGMTGFQGPFTRGAFSATQQVGVALTDPFAISHWATIRHTGGGQITSFDMETAVVIPEPTTILTWIGMAGLGFVGYRRRRRKSA